MQKNKDFGTFRQCQSHVACCMFHRHHLLSLITTQEPYPPSSGTFILSCNVMVRSPNHVDGPTQQRNYQHVDWKTNFNTPTPLSPSSRPPRPRCTEHCHVTQIGETYDLEVLNLGARNRLSPACSGHPVPSFI